MITIQQATKEDAPDIQNIFYQTWLTTYPNAELGITRGDIEEKFKDAFTDKQLAEFAERIAIPQKGKLVVVARDAGLVIGVCRVFVREHANQLQAIYVLPEHQRKGVGTILWKEALKFFDKEKDTIVQVATYNTQAIDFYKKLGFVDTGERFTERSHRMPISGVLIPEMKMVRRR